MKQKYPWVNINELKLWDDNPRNSDIHTMKRYTTQKELIRSFFSSPKEKKEMKAMALDILENGLMETELMCVYKDKEGELISIDGNRRLASIKIIKKPSLVNHDKDLFKFYSSLDKRAVNSSVHCFITTDINRAYLIAEKKHLGPNKGKGLVKWSTDGKTFFYDQVLKAKKDAPSYVLRTNHKELFDDLISEYTSTGSDRLLNQLVFKKHLEINDYSTIDLKKATRVKEAMILIKEYLDEQEILLSRLKKKDVIEAIKAKMAPTQAIQDINLNKPSLSVNHGETFSLYSVITNPLDFESIRYVSDAGLIVDSSGLLSHENKIGEYSVKIIGTKEAKEYSKVLRITVVPIDNKPIKVKPSADTLFTTEFNHPINISRSINSFIKQANHGTMITTLPLVANACLRIVLEESIHEFISFHKLKPISKLNELLQILIKFFDEDKLNLVAEKINYSYNKIKSFLDDLDPMRLSKKLNHLAHNITYITTNDLKAHAETVSKLLVLISASMDK